MKIDIESYKVSKGYIQTLYLNNVHKNEPLGLTISMLSAIPPYVPCIVVAFWIGEACNWHPDVIECIKRLKEFYGYEDIANKPDGSPI
jgi:hypothetical protein